MNLKKHEVGPEGLRIMMSIRPEWTEKIFAGSKVIEVRRTAPLAAFGLKRAPQSWMKLKPWGVRK